MADNKRSVAARKLWQNNPARRQRSSEMAIKQAKLRIACEGPSMSAIKKTLRLGRKIERLTRRQREIKKKIEISKKRTAQLEAELASIVIPTAKQFLYAAPGRND